MSYIRSKHVAKRLKKSHRRVSGADILRQELDVEEGATEHSLLSDNSISSIRSGLGGHNRSHVHHPSLLSNVITDEGSMDGSEANENADEELQSGTQQKISKQQMSSEDFEEWIKLATDNKINSTNSWNFALIDYFHEMSLLKEGDNINFQKASATLDGCVKIYSSRVDSIATETGRLLTGLATKKNANGENGQNGQNDGGDDENLDEDGEGNDNDAEGSKQKQKANRARIVETTLVKFDTIKMKKLDQELEIDPLFKRALSEFDEGGAKSLLLNILNINNEARIVFDAAGKTNSGDEEELEKSTLDPIEEDEDEDEVEKEEDEEADTQEPEKDNAFKTEFPTEQNDLDVRELKDFLLTSPVDDDIEVSLKDLDICPSMKSIEIVLNDINQAKTILGDVNSGKSELQPIGFGSNVPELPPPVEPNYNMMPGDDFLDFGYDEADDNGIADAFNDDDDHSSNNANEKIISELQKLDENNDDEKDDNKEEGIMEQIVDKDLMAYFDQNMKINWAGPEHWKVSALKSRSKGITNSSIIGEPDYQQRHESKEQKAVKLAKKKKKEEFRINFLDIEDDEANDEFEEKIFKTSNKTLLPKTQQTSNNHNLLPKDIFFSSERLLKLFCKPDPVKSLRRKSQKVDDTETSPKNANHPEDLAINEAADENYWANRYEEEAQVNDDVNNADNDNNDNNGSVLDFNNFEDEITPQAEPTSTFLNTQGLDVIAGSRRARPEYVNFSRTAKRVDVKYLKDNLWKSLNYELNLKINDDYLDRSKENAELPKDDVKEEDPIKFTKVVKNIAKMYPEEEKKDLSTSFCFICLLHLANEHDLTIENEDDKNFEDLKVIYNDSQPITATN